MAHVRKKFIEILEKVMKEGEQMTPEEMLITHEGIVYPTVFCNPEQFKALEAFQARSDDVVLAGYCKSGEFVCLFVFFYLHRLTLGF